MKALELWKDALAVCKPARFMALIKNTFRSMREVFGVLWASWFLIPFVLMVGASTYWAGLYGAGLPGFIVSAHVVILLAAPIFLIAARPSQREKDYHYIKTNKSRALWFAFISVLISLFLSFFFKPLAVIVVFLLSLLPAVSDISLLFYLDRYELGTSKATMNGLRMVFYNYPLFVLAITGTYAISRLIGFLIEKFFIAINLMSFPQLIAVAAVGGVSLMMHLFFTMFIKCLTVNLYNNRLHAQPELYTK